jgi:dTDP-4-amino-4,6-dideoxygalactose transaminase
MIVPFFEVRRSARQTLDLERAAARVIRSGRYILGPEVEAFEHEAAAFLGVRHAVGISNGTDALVVALQCAMPEGTIVAVPAFTFIATATAVKRAGFSVAFQDVRDDDLTIDFPGGRRMPACVEPLPVHLFGCEAGVRSVVEDGAQAFGSLKIADTDNRVVCYSFFPTKNLGGFGDGGLIATNDGSIAERARALRNHGSRTRYVHEEFGGNYRLDEMQAALLRVALRKTPIDFAARAINAIEYTNQLGNLHASGAIRLPKLPLNAVLNQFVIRVSEEHRDALRAHLAANEIGAEIYYPTPLHLQPCFAYAGYMPGDLPVAERAAREVLALPIFPGLRVDELDHVCRTIVRFFDELPAR